MQQLRRHMNQLCPIPVECHSSTATFIYMDLKDVTHIFLWQNAIRRPTISRTNSTLLIADTILWCTQKNCFN